LKGPRSAEILEHYVPSSLDLSKFYFMQSRLTNFDNDPSIPCRINRSGYTGEDGFEISVSNAHAVRVTTALLSSGIAQMAGLGARDSLRLEAGLCLYGNDIDEQTTPIEADLAWTIGKRRRQLGDFPGAKIILEQLKTGPPRKRVGIKSSGSCPRSGAEIRNGRGEHDRIIGKVTSGCPSPSLKLLNIGMAYVETPYAKIGNKVVVNIRNRTIEAEVIKMPFVPANYYKAPTNKKK
jgi:aminomethyltransferase